MFARALERRALASGSRLNRMRSETRLTFLMISREPEASAHG